MHLLQIAVLFLIVHLISVTFTKSYILKVLYFRITDEKFQRILKNMNFKQF